MKKSKKKSTKKKISVMLPMEVVDFYREVAKLSKVSFNDTVNVAIAIYLVNRK